MRPDRQRNRRGGPAFTSRAGNRELHRLNRELARGGPVDGEPSRIDTQTGDLFAWAAKQRKYREAGSISLRREGHSPAGHWLERGDSIPRNRTRLTNYLYSGSFGRLTPARHTDRVQRNRVVFVVVLVLIALYITYRMAVH